MQDYSLLFGSLGIFFIIGLLMYFSKNVRWHKDETIKAYKKIIYHLIPACPADPTLLLKEKGAVNPSHFERESGEVNSRSLYK